MPSDEIHNLDCEGAMKKNPLIDEDVRLLTALHHTTIAIIRAREKELSQYGLTYMQVAVLFTIQAVGDKTTPAEISRRLFREPHSVSGLVSRMEKAGLVKKDKDLDRKNLIRVTMTDKGKEAYTQSTKKDSIRRIMSSLSKEERKLLKSYLKTLQKKALSELGMNRRLRFYQSL